MGLSFSFIMGFALGIEHVTGDEDEEYHWLISIHLGILRAIIINYNVENM